MVQRLTSRLLQVAFFVALTAFQWAPADAQYRDDRDRGERGERYDRGERGGENRYGEPRRDEWVLLGEQTVSFSNDRDVITVGRDEGTYSKLRVDARNNDIYLYGLRVVFGNRSEQRIQVNQLIPAGGRSAEFDLQGDRRGILTITLDYKARPNFPGRSLVSVYGATQRGPRPGDGYGGGYPGRPEEAGRPQVIAEESFDRRTDRIEFRLPRRDMRLSQLSLRAVDDSVAIESMEVRFSAGPAQFFNIYDRLGPGDETQAFSLDRDRRTVTGVTVIKRPSWRTGNNRLQLIGVERLPPPPPPLGAEPGRAPPGWVMFGAQSVSPGVDRDVIEIGREIGQFSRIVLAVRDGDVYLREVTFIYANGERDTKNVYTLIPSGSRTRAIEVNNRRFLRQIEMVYQGRPNFRNDRRPIVEVYGEYDRRWIGDNGGYREYNRGWLLLGAQRAQMFTSDDDAFKVGSQLGTFRALRLNARRHAVRITGIRIVYGNGEVETLPLFQELRDGEATRTIDLIRRDRYIKEVQVRYRTKLNFQGEGLVELWGLR